MTTDAIIAIVCAGGVFVLFGVIAIASGLQAEKLHREQERLRAEGLDGYVTVLSTVNGSVSAEGNRFVVDCELEFVPSSVHYRATPLKPLRRRLRVPIVWMSRFQPGIVLRARVHPDITQMQLHLEDGAPVEVSGY